MGGTVALLLFVTHFGMYCRPFNEVQPNDHVELPRNSNMPYNDGRTSSAVEMPHYQAGDNDQSAIPDDADKVFQAPVSNLDK